MATFVKRCTGPSEALESTPRVPSSTASEETSPIESYTILTSQNHSVLPYCNLPPIFEASPTHHPSLNYSMSLGSLVTAENISIKPAFNSRMSCAQYGGFGQFIDNCNKFKLSPNSYQFQIRIDNQVKILGYMPPELVKKAIWNSTNFTVTNPIHGALGTVTLAPKPEDGKTLGQLCKNAFVEFTHKNKHNTKLDVAVERWLEKRDSEKDFHSIWVGPSRIKPIHETDKLGFSIPSCIRGIFGVVTFGVHLNVYSTWADKESGVTKTEIFVAIRSKDTAMTYPGMFDQPVAGAMDPKDDFNPVETLIREGKEEAGLRLREAFNEVHDMDGEVKLKFKNGNCELTTVPKRISFWDVKDNRAGTAEKGHVEPGLRFTFDLKVPENCRDEFKNLKKQKSSIDGFQWQTPEQVKSLLLAKEWKPNSGLVMLDFLLRHNLVEPNEVKQGNEGLKKLAEGLNRELPL